MWSDLTYIMFNLSFLTSCMLTFILSGSTKRFLPNNSYTVKLGYNEQLGTGHFFVMTEVRYNRVSLCTKITNLISKSVRYNRVFVNNRVCYNQAHYDRVSL